MISKHDNNSNLKINSVASPYNSETAQKLSKISLRQGLLQQLKTNSDVERRVLQAKQKAAHSKEADNDGDK